MRTGATCCHPRKEIFCGTVASIQAAFLIIGLIFAFDLRGFAQTSSPTEYRIKAAFLYNFAKFIKWPPQTFAGPESPIVIGVLGENVFGGDLEQTIHDKTFNDHPFQFKEFHSVNQATNCQILFISASEQERLPKILSGLRGTSVLTVSEMDHFIEAGGMINFVIEEKRIHFQINNEAAEKAGLIISSKLLSLATHGH
jgi:YfiR/HmsC-like